MSKIKKFFSKWQLRAMNAHEDKPSPDQKTQLHELRKGLELRPDEVDTGMIVPVFAPATFFTAGNWPGPHARLRTREIELVWALLLPSETMRYVDFRMEKYWDAQGIDWKALALRNLEEQSGEKLGTHEFRRENGSLYGIALMYPDGVGPSRLLLRDQLCSCFPEGYRVALPEMSCAFAFSAGLGEKETATVQKLVDTCYKDGTRPLVPGIHAPESLLLET